VKIKGKGFSHPKAARMVKEQPRHPVRRPGLKIRVYTSQIEFINTRGCLWLSHTTRVPFRAIVPIDYSDIFETITIETRGGKIIKLGVAGVGDAAKAATEAIKKNL
jgi:hypothetical protein